MSEGDYMHIVLVYYLEIKLNNDEVVPLVSHINGEVDLSMEGNPTYASLIKLPALDITTKGDGLQKYDSFSRWMSSELGEVDDSHLKSNYEMYWSVDDSGISNHEQLDASDITTVGEGSNSEMFWSDDDSGISNHEQLDAYLLGSSISQEQLYSIIIFSPHWAYAGMETEVIITGKCLKNKEEARNCKWSCMFGEIEVPADILADGALCCCAPPHKSGRVPFYVTRSNRLACSEVCEFEYRDPSTQYMEYSYSYINRVNDMDLHKRLDKLINMDSFDHSKLSSRITNEKQKLIDGINSVMREVDDEWFNVLKPLHVEALPSDIGAESLVDRLLKDKLHMWLINKVIEDGKGPNVLDKDGQGVIHLAAALGYDWVIKPIVTSGVSVNFRDAHGWTALHWAAFCGRLRTVATLIRLDAASGALTYPTPEFPSERTPADLASGSGHKRIVGFLAESCLTLNVKESEGGAVPAVFDLTGVEDIAEPSSVQPFDGDIEDGLLLKDSRSAVQKATQAAACIHQVFRVESFQRKKLTMFGDGECGISDERALSLISCKTAKSKQQDLLVRAAATKIQNKFRGWKGRKEFLVIRQRIITIQAHVRGHQVRKHYKKIVWTVGIVEKIILRWRRKGSGLRGFRSEGLIEGPSMQDEPTKGDEYDFLKEGRKQTELRLEKALGRVKSMVQYPEARHQYRRLMTVVNELQETKPEYSVSLLQTNLRTEDATVYCREEDETKLIETLLSDDRRKCCVTVVRVFGASGIGKTTFVNLVYNNSTICEIFEKRAWVCANDKLDLKGMMKAILESLTGVFCSLTELTEIQEAVKEELAGKSFFLVLDNICSDDLCFWNSLLASLSMGAKGSTIIATTDSEVVINTDMIYSHELKRLSKKDSSFLLQQVVFDGRDCRTDINLTRILKHISTKCGGLPLVLRAFGGIVRAELEANSWAALLGSSSIAFDEVSQPLRLSYRQLNERLKRCFKYCSLFPKGHMFEKDHLVRLWMSQGFIENKQGKNEHDTANEYFDELLKRSFFQHSPDCHPKEKKFVMHDLFHELAESVSTDKCFRTETYELSCIPEQVCYLSLIAHEFEITVEPASFQDLRDNITTLLVINKFAMKCKGSIHLQVPAILNDLFANLRLLRSLDLSNTNIELIPESIAYLQFLRYLSLSKTRIRSLPESLCSLYNLQTLELRGCSYLSELPAYMKILVSLIHLDVSKECGFVFRPSGIGQLTSLLTLSTFTIGRNERHCGIKELKELINLRGELCIGGLGNVLTGDEAKEAELETKEKLTSLTLQWLNCDEDLQDDQSTETASEVLQNFLPNNNLEELTILVTILVINSLVGWAINHFRS